MHPQLPALTIGGTVPKESDELVILGYYVMALRPAVSSRLSGLLYVAGSPACCM